MSGLARLLAGRVDTGVYTWVTAAPSTDVKHAAEQAGWRLVELDTWWVDGKRDFLAECKRSFGFPDWVGSNYDALADALSDVRPSADHHRGVLVLWQGWRPLAQEHPQVFFMALSVFVGRVSFSPSGQFAVLLQTDESTDVDLPDLDSQVSRGC